jgi:hypothetical protein
MGLPPSPVEAQVKVNLPSLKGVIVCILATNGGPDGYSEITFDVDRKPLEVIGVTLNL